MAGETSHLMEIPIAKLLIAIWERRRWLAIVTLIGTLVAIGVALLLPNEYTSIAQLMPPNAQTLSGVSLLDPLAGPNSSSLRAGLLQENSPGALAIAVLSSRTIQDNIVNSLDLRSVYHSKFQVDARKSLAERTQLTEDKKSGIVTIAVTDKDKYRARAIAQAYVDNLNQLVNTLSTSSARRERIFLEQRLKSVKADLDASTQQLSTFSSRNKTFDPEKQGEATVEAASKLQGEMISAESELSGLEATYSGDNVRVRAARARVEELQSQLRRMGGLAEEGNSAEPGDGQLLPSVRELPLLGATYYTLYRQVEISQTLYETLSKQYELARVEEAKEIPVIKVLDAPNLPERRSFPHRSIFALVGMLFSGIVGVAWIVMRKMWELTDDSSALKEIARAVRRSVRKEDATGSE